MLRLLSRLTIFNIKFLNPFYGLELTREESKDPRLVTLSTPSIVRQFLGLIPESDTQPAVNYQREREEECIPITEQRPPQLD